MSGCIKDESNSNNTNFINVENQPPISIIKAPDTAFFNEIIELDASDSFDSDGEIIAYKWNFLDGSSKEGEKIEHIFYFSDNYGDEFPIIYPISLFLIDDSGSTVITTHQIRLFPKDFIFFLNSGQISYEKPDKSDDKIKASVDGTELIYSLNEDITIFEGNCNLSLFISKQIFTYINKIQASLLNSNDEVVLSLEKNFGFFEIWNNKEIILSSDIDEEITFKTLKVEIFGLSLTKNIKIQYGSKMASKLSFSFSNDLYY
jgi:hypothetical protein